MRLALPFLAAFAIVTCGGDSSTTEPPPGNGRIAGIPPGWVGSGNGYEIGRDNGDSHAGETAAYITASSRNEQSFAVLVQMVRADAYRGKRMRWSGWVKHTDLAGEDIGLWMRVDGPGEVASFDNMSTRSLTGSSDWH